MDFYGIIEKNEFDILIKRARKTCIKDALIKLKEFEAMNQTFLKEAMPDNTPDILIKKRTAGRTVDKIRRKMVQ